MSSILVAPAKPDKLAFFTSMKVIRYKHNLDFSYALGATLVFELLKTRPELVNRIFIKSNVKNTPDLEQILALCSEHKIEVLEGDKAFNILSPKENCFIIAEFKKFKTELDKESSNIVLVNPSDAGNIGTIIRTAIGLGFNNIAIISPAVDVFDPKAIRASMGAIFHANVHYFDTIEEYQSAFPNHNRYAFMLRNAKKFDETPIKAPFSLIFGNEASGLSDEYADFCQSVKISQTSNIDSFSLPIAASIAMYENRLS